MMNSKYYRKMGQVRGVSSLSVNMEGWRIMEPFFVFIWVAVFGLLSGCASIPVPRVEKVPIDHFQAYDMPDGIRISPESVDDAIPDVDILAIDHEIRSMLDDTVAKISAPVLRLEALNEILIRTLRYDSVDDRYGIKTAQETFDTGTGNCLSFSNLFVAMARYVGLNAEFQEIPTLPNWTREGEVLFFTRHIGASVDIYKPYDHVIELHTSREAELVVWSSSSRSRYILHPSGLDRYAPELNPYSARPIPDHRAFAQYYSNIGSRHLVEGNRAEAFRYYVKAIKTDPQSSFAWSNLGVLYTKNRQFEAAEAAYLQGFGVTRGLKDTSVLTIMNNMASLYDRIGDTEKAAFYEKQVASFREKNPYFKYAAAITAYYDAFYEESVKHFKDAIRLKDDEHLFYYGLALAYLKMDETEKAKENIDRAIRYTWDDEKKGYYRRVLERLVNSAIN
jgi:tetratricopeptide (TPR) repeat protein